MRKIFVCFLILIVSSAAFAEVNDAETHKVIGSLYSLAAAVELNGKINPDVNSLVRFFEKIPAGWQNEVKINRDKNSVWVGISLKKYSSAHRYLQEHSQELGILLTPDGEAWLKAADIVKKKLEPIEFSAAEADGITFFNAPNSDLWVAARPNFKSSSKKKILAVHGTDKHPELAAPKIQEAQRVSIYDEVRPSSVRVPDEMHMGRKKNSFDMSMEIGDVIFNPIPNQQNN